MKTIDEINSELAEIAAEMHGRWPEFLEIDPPWEALPWERQAQLRDEVTTWVATQTPRIGALLAERPAPEHDLRDVTSMDELAFRLGWDDTELAHAIDDLGTRQPEPKDECIVRTHSGREIRCPAYPRPCSYLRVVQHGFELAYWDSDEWQEEPRSVMGAIIGALKNGVETPSDQNADLAVVFAKLLDRNASHRDKQA